MASIASTCLTWIGSCSTLVQIAAAQPCIEVQQFESDFRAAHSEIVGNSDRAGEYLARAMELLGNPACAESRASVRMSAGALARMVDDWRALATLSVAALAEMPANPPDSLGADSRAFWLGEQATARLKLVTQGVCEPTVAAAATDAFVSYASSPQVRALGNPDRWLLPCATAIAAKGAMWRNAGDRLAASVAEHQGSLLVANHHPNQESLSRLGGYAPDEFLQRAASDYLAEGRVQDCVSTLVSIAASPSSVRPAAVHARVIIDVADKGGRLAEYVTAVWASLPHDAALVQLLNGSAVRAKPRDAVLIGPLLDEALLLPEAVFDEATALRDAKRDPSRMANDRPVRAHVMINRAVLAADQGDFAMVDRLLEELEARGWLGDWCQSQRTKIEFERRRTR